LSILIENKKIFNHEKHKQYNVFSKYRLSQPRVPALITPFLFSTQCLAYINKKWGRLYIFSQEKKTTQQKHPKKLQQTTQPKPTNKKKQKTNPNKKKQTTKTQPQTHNRPTPKKAAHPKNDPNAPNKTPTNQN